MKSETETRAIVKERVVEVNPDLLYLELAEIIKNSNYKSWEIAKRIHKLTELGHTRALIAQRLKSFGVHLDVSSISVYHAVYDFYVNRLDLFEMVKDQPLYKLYYIQQIFEELGLGRNQIIKELEAVRDMTRAEAVAYLKEKYHLAKEENYRAIRVDESVYASFEEWVDRLQAAADTLGENTKVSNTAALEIAMEVLLQLPNERIIELWRVLHGEV